MFDLALKTIDGGNKDSIHSATTSSLPKTVPFDCELVGVAINFTVVIDAEHTFDVLIDEAEVASGNVDIQVANGSLQGIFFPDKQVFILAGEAISLSSNVETVAASNAFITYILRPLSTRPVGEVWLDGENISDVDTADDVNQSKVVPIDAELLGVAIRFDQTITAETTLDVVDDTVEQTPDVVIVTGVDGGYFPLDEQHHVRAGAELNLKTNGETATANTVGYVTYVLRPTGTQRRAGDVFLHAKAGLPLHTAAAKTSPVVSPVKGEIKRLVLHNTVAMDAVTLLTVFINGVDQTADFSMPATVADEFGAVLELEADHHLYVNEGDRIEFETDGGQTAVTNNCSVCCIIEPT